MPFFLTNLAMRMSTWLLNAAYVALLIVVSPVLLYRRFRHGKYRRGWGQKLTGRLVRRHPERRCIWFHAVSVGEVLQLQRVLDEAVARWPDAELLVTTTTETGFDVAASKYPQHTVAYFPLDFSWAVNTALHRVRPDFIVLVELELWPNFILAARQRGIPLALINGRISEKSFRGYNTLKPLLRQVLGCFEVLAVQNETYANRLQTLGAPPERITVSGNIKFDRVESDRNNPRTVELRHAFGLTEGTPVFIAGSTQEPEEEYALSAWEQARREFPSLRLILVPRHKERFDDVAHLVTSRNLNLLRRSESVSGATTAEAAHTNDAPVLLLDTLGELAACWGLATIAFVGGSLTQRGGQNMLEPAGYGAAVLFGPNTWNFKDIVDSLMNRQAAQVIHTPEELTATLRYLLAHPQEAVALGQSAREFVATQQGATLRTMSLLTSILPTCHSNNHDQRAA